MNKKRTFTICGSIISLSISLLAGFLTTEMHAGESTSESAKAMKPLKVFILAGQSNMQGTAQLSTMPSMAADPESKALHDLMIDEDGKPRVHENVSIVFFTGDGGKRGQERTHSEKSGPLSIGFGGAFGPEWAFGAALEHHFNAEGDPTQPILIIKTAWGGKDIRKDFRPPSAGVQPFEMKQAEWEQQVAQWKQQGVYDGKIGALEKEMAGNEEYGWYYREMIRRVKQVLDDPGKYSPHYDPQLGYELAGFVWFQGFNDKIAFYPHVEPQRHIKTKAPRDFSEYSRLLGCFIRDVRKELDVPGLPFVIGVIGIHGEGNDVEFREAQAAPASWPEFAGTVAAVRTEKFWDQELMDVLMKYQWEWKRVLDQARPYRDQNGKFITEKAYALGWEFLGTPHPADRIWHYTTFNDEDLFATNKDGGQTRQLLEKVPSGLEGWEQPDFDDSAWSQGKAPFGKGEWKVGKNGILPYHTQWKEDHNKLLMRTTFEVSELEEGAKYRFDLRNAGCYHVYLNGHRVHSYPWFYKDSRYRPVDPDVDLSRHLKTGRNTLAVYAADERLPYNSIDVIISESDREGQQRFAELKEKIFPAKKEAMAEGASNADFHYLGSGRIYSNIGEAFAKAWLEVMK